ncbi:MAG: RsmB/NOP family class I SAM-dependent RNA methyltransferase [Defluviitaleaceae bacterium]|nr:RsmB/NOP family class I SAM-dependent RNA methyltransferase [Defluviitaleaceae bacterium]
MQLPQQFLVEMKEILGAEYQAFLQGFDALPLRGVRFNLLKLRDSGPEELRGLAGEVFGQDITRPVPWCGEGFIYPSAASEAETLRPAKSVFYRAGLFYIQEPSAMSPAQVLAAQPGERVLDICAAPGGKSAQIAGHMQNAGLLVSNDLSPTRSRALVKNLELAGVRNAIVLTEHPKKLAARFSGFFDRILVDAPCSGEGMFRRDPDAVKAYSAAKPEVCMAMQREILRHAAKMLRPGGRLVYSTCTFNISENEGMIAEFLAENEGFSLVEINHRGLGLSCGRGAPEVAAAVARIWPHLSPGEGHFIACLQKDDGEHLIEDAPAEAPKMSKKQRKGETSNIQLLPREFTAFCQENLMGFNMATPFQLHGKSLYLQPETIDLSGLRVARSGWYAGEIEKDRFTPSQAFAMGLTRAEACFAVELPEADAWRYLKGESLPFAQTLSATVKKPWVLICHRGYPLGWAKLVQGRLKCQLPTGWCVI